MPFRKCIERDFPHIVDTVVPERGLRSKRAAIMDFHARHGIKPYPSERYHDDCQYIRWHFADRQMAEAFAAKFARRIFLNGIEGIALKKPAVEDLDQSQESESASRHSRY